MPSTDDPFTSSAPSPGLCAGCGALREALCQECRDRWEREDLFAAFLLRFDKTTPKIPMSMYPEYREWLDWAKQQELHDLREVPGRGDGK